MSCRVTLSSSTATFCDVERNPLRRAPKLIADRAVTAWEVGSEAHHLSKELNPDRIDIKPLVTEFNAIDRVHGVMIEKDVAIVAGSLASTSTNTSAIHDDDEDNAACVANFAFEFRSVKIFSRFPHPCFKWKLSQLVSRGARQLNTFGRDAQSSVLPNEFVPRRAPATRMVSRTIARWERQSKARSTCAAEKNERRGRFLGPKRFGAALSI